jgi:shikimate kinase
MKIYIIGFMGSGKSTYGKQLADAMGYSFKDLDSEIEKKEGISISEIFETKGETAFREAEHKALLETEKEDNTIIATGGGAPCFQDQMEWMNAHGVTIYLKLLESALKNRLEPEMKDRPLLKNLDAETLGDFIYKTLRERAYYYHRAQIVIDPGQISPEELSSILKSNYL